MDCLLFFSFVSVEPPKWNDEKKSDGTIIEDNGQKVRNTCDSYRNVISTEGFSQGVHSWIVEFKGDSNGHYNFMIVCDPHNDKVITGKTWLVVCLGNMQRETTKLSLQQRLHQKLFCGSLLWFWLIIQDRHLLLSLI